MAEVVDAVGPVAGETSGPGATGQGRAEGHELVSGRGGAAGSGRGAGPQQGGTLPPEREVLDWTVKCNRCHGRGHKEYKCPSVT
jgi:hypothetical protein